MRQYGAQFHGILEDTPDPLGRGDAGEGRDAESRRAPQGGRRGAGEDRRRDSEAGLRGTEEAPKLLVIESLHGMSHNTIPHTNVMIQEMGNITGAWEAVFDNDLDNLKYPKIKDYDGVFLNSIVGELLAEPAVRDGLARFVKEGGGLGGIHGTPWASRNWDEFAEMIGAQIAPHRIEQGVMKVYDAANPLMKSFAGKDLPFREESYRFEHEGRGRLRWDSVRVLLTVALDDPTIEPVRGMATSVPTTSTRSRGFAPTARAASSTTRSATCRRRS